MLLIKNKSAGTLRIPWGSWDLQDYWYPNDKLKMTPMEQYEANISQGIRCDPKINLAPGG